MKNLKLYGQHGIAILLLFMLISAKPAVTGGLKPGDKAIDFKLKNVDGKMVSLADFHEAKGFIVVFTCNHCPFSVAYEDRIIALHNKFAPLGYPVVAINPNDAGIVPEDSYENMITRSQEKKFPFVYLYDQTQETAIAYGALKTPHVYILSKKDADILVQYVGAIDDNTDDVAAVKNKYVENAMKDILTGQKVLVNSTKAIGCSVKYRN